MQRWMQNKKINVEKMDSNAVQVVDIQTENLPTSNAVQLEFSNDLKIASEVEVRNDPESESECGSSSESDVSSASDTENEIYGTESESDTDHECWVNAYNYSTV